MNERLAHLESAAAWQALLGYLNFSEGKADSSFQKQLNDAYGMLAERGAPEPWVALDQQLRYRLDALQAGTGGAFRDVTQAEGVLSLVFKRLLPAYRRHHADLLFHLSERELFQPFFLARGFEAVLSQGGPWEEESRIVVGALAQLNDFVGYRPVAILETRPRGEPYDHERVRPIPLFIKGAGVAWGRYHDLVRQALDILAATDPDVLASAGFEMDLLDELALDPRAYDQGHPANRRPNHVFGEWDPHHLDGQGRYRRYVARQVMLDALLERVEQTRERDRQELLLEAAAVLAGTLLMATGLSGNSPAAHDSSTTLATLMPRIAQCRDAFYAGLIQRVSGLHGEHLRREAHTTRQPFGGVRQHLNQALARHRAAQLQQRQLAILFADMGYPEASREEAGRIPVASVRFLSDILSRLATGQALADQGEPAEAARLLPDVEELLRRGIACGALVDPWNILGFQGLFPLFNAREDSIRDPRIDELVDLVDQTFSLYSRLVSEAAASGHEALRDSLLDGLKRLAAWWDRFATITVSDVRLVHGGETLDSARHVGTALSLWHRRGDKAGDLAFWKEHLAGFQSPKAFALVVDALLRQEDYRAAMALLMNWLAHPAHMPLEYGEYSFHALALRWMLGMTGRTGGEPGGEVDRWTLVKKFFDYLEANAEEEWQVPVLHRPAVPGETDHGEDSLYSAAYDDVTYRDSADDSEEGAVAGGGPQEDFDLDIDVEGLEVRLRFLSTVARLWQIAARSAAAGSGRAAQEEQALASWLAVARENRRKLLILLDDLHAWPVPEPLGSYDSLVEYDRRRHVKEQLLYTAISTCLDASMALGTLAGVLGEAGGEPAAAAPWRPEWERAAVRLEQALLRGDAGTVRTLLPQFLEHFRHEPLLFTALSDSGRPREILRVRRAQAVLQALVTNLPRLGLLRETYELLRTARAMEQVNPPEGRGVTEFNRLFQAGYQAVVEAAIDSACARAPAPPADRELVEVLEAMSWPFVSLWVEHSASLQLSALEMLPGEEEWQPLREFVRKYGGDLFHARFMTLANLRGILHRGVGAYLDYLAENPDPLHPLRLLADLGRSVSRENAVRWLQCILQALVENYEEYKDYNTTTPQSDYGENLHTLLDFLRLKASYERHAWQGRPVVMAHEMLVRRGRMGAALLWTEAYQAISGEWADQHLDGLAKLEQAHGMQLRTVADRLRERFVLPLAIDRVCALIEPAMVEARRPGPRATFERLREELQDLAGTPSGVGLDVPAWLRQLELEVHRVRARRTALAALAEDFFPVPKKTLSFDELREQVQQWEKPLSDD
ncbi:MAG TPA: hypothetical protein VG013_16470 [Gemmataceae bacterium]|nr:hypothetical protein [Gemmataceae bacterium]